MVTVQELIYYVLPKYVSGVVLDVGGGKGSYRKEIGTKAIQYLVSDLFAPEADFHDDARSLSNKDESFDTVLCFEVLEHIAETDKVVSELYRVLKKGGYIITTTPFMYHQHSNPDDFYRFTPRGLEYVFKRAGFKIIESGTMGGILSVAAKFFKKTSKEYGRDGRPNSIFKKPFFFIHRVLMKLQKLSKGGGDFFTNSYLIARK